jgi:hypothetical protein
MLAGVASILGLALVLAKMLKSVWQFCSNRGKYAPID